MFKGLCHQAILFINVTLQARETLLIQTHINSRQSGVQLCTCVWGGGMSDRERSVHYAWGLTFDGPCSPVSKTKAGPDGHLMCSAIYCQSAQGNKEQPCYCSSLSRGPPLWKSLCMYHLERERDRKSESVWTCACCVLLYLFGLSPSVWQRLSSTLWLERRSRTWTSVEKISEIQRISVCVPAGLQ